MWPTSGGASDRDHECGRACLWAGACACMYERERMPGPIPFHATQDSLCLSCLLRMHACSFMIWDFMHFWFLRCSVIIKRWIEYDLPNYAFVSVEGAPNIYVEGRSSTQDVQSSVWILFQSKATVVLWRACEEDGSADAPPRLSQILHTVLLNNILSKCNICICYECSCWWPS